MAEVIHSQLRAKDPGADLKLPPVVLLTAAGIIRGEVTSVWGYLSRLQTGASPEDETQRAILTTLFTDPAPQAEVVTSPRQVSTIYLTSVTVTLPGSPHPPARFEQLAVSLGEVVAWSLGSASPSLEPKLEVEGSDVEISA